LNPAGAVGNAAAADAERGRLVIEKAAKEMVILLQEVADYSLDNIAPPPTS